MMPVQLSLVKSLGTAVKADDTRSKMAAHSHCRSKSREPFRAPIPNGISDVGATARRSGAGPNPSPRLSPARQSVVAGKSVSVRVDLGGRRIINKKTEYYITT